MRKYKTIMGTGLIEAERRGNMEFVGEVVFDEDPKPDDWIISQFGVLTSMRDSVFRKTYIPAEQKDYRDEQAERRNLAVVDDDGTVLNIMEGVSTDFISRRKQKLTKPLEKGGATGKLVDLQDYPAASVGSQLPWPTEKRNALLLETDWTEMPSVKASHSEEWVKSWETYRQALRDLPTTYPNATDVIWPEKPEK